MKTLPITLLQILCKVTLLITKMLFIISEFQKTISGGILNHYLVNSLFFSRNICWLIQLMPGVLQMEI